MERLSAKYAWAALIGGVILYDALCPEGETLSEGVDRLLEEHPLYAIAAVGTTALHLLNILPQCVDPLHRVATILRH